jgi:signal transduction histidine kinase
VESVFNAFTRVEEHRHYQGTGLGLAIVQRIVQRHGGTIGVEPGPDGGSRFWLTLAAAATP